jgi:hypothetical protein
MDETCPLTPTRQLANAANAAPTRQFVKSFVLLDSRFCFFPGLADERESLRGQNPAVFLPFHSTVYETSSRCFEGVPAVFNPSKVLVRWRPLCPCPTLFSNSSGPLFRNRSEYRSALHGGSREDPLLESSRPPSAGVVKFIRSMHLLSASFSALLAPTLRQSASYIYNHSFRRPYPLF